MTALWMGRENNEGNALLFTVYVCHTLQIIIFMEKYKTNNMTNEQIEKLCKEKEQKLLNKYFGNLVHEAAHERPETIGEYSKDLPLRIEAEYKEFLEELWKEHAPEELKGTPLILEEQKLRKLVTDDDRELIDEAHKDATEQTLWERITKTNHKDVTYYKGLLQEYTRDLLMVMREDFLEEITGHHIENKAFEDD